VFEEKEVGVLTVELELGVGDVSVCVVVVVVGGSSIYL
jgi:hypothetical protein